MKKFANANITSYTQTAKEAPKVCFIKNNIWEGCSVDKK